jgi:Ni,Fe-hydrogenase I cytochrome b subunit
MWQNLVRITHRVNALAIFALSAIGLYIGWPFLNGGGFTMRWAYAAHIVFGCIFPASVTFRVYWSLRGNRRASYRAFSWSSRVTAAAICGAHCSTTSV